MGVTNSAPAPPRKWVERAAITLTGLPPTKEQIARIEANPDLETWETIIDELLANPAYGERWARHWMDVARYADTFDRKPLLNEWLGKMLPLELKTERPTGAALRTPFEFARYGQSGLEVSELFQHTAKHADDLCVIRSMQADVPNHEPSLMLMNCGDARLSRPSMGSWVTYGLGSENENLPAYVSMCPGGMPIKRAENWRSSFLPGSFQGTYRYSGRDFRLTDVHGKVVHDLIA